MQKPYHIFCAKIKTDIDNTIDILAKIKLFLFPCFSINFVNGISNNILNIGYAASVNSTSDGERFFTCVKNKNAIE